MNVLLTLMGCEDGYKDIGNGECEGKIKALSFH